MGQVVQALEGPIAPMVCASEDPLHAGMCVRTGFCNVSLLWARVRTAVMQALDSMNLAELALPRPSHPFHARPVLDTIQPLAERDAREPIARP